MADRTRGIAGIIDKCPDRWVKASLASLADYLVERYDEEVGAWDFMAALKGLELLAGKALEIPASDEDHKKLQTDLGLAEVRIKQLQEQLTACEAALAERNSQIEKLDGYAKTNAVEVSRKLVWGAVHNAGRAITNGRIPRWAAVKSALGVGSTTARQLCRVHKAEPDEQVGRGDQCGGCKRIDSYLEVCGGCVCAPTGPDWSHCIRHDEDMGGKTCGCNPKK